MAIPTVQQVLNRAYAKSLKNQPTQIANEATELVGEVNRVMKAIYSIAAGINPLFFGKSASMIEASGSWPMPTDAEAIFYLEQAAPVAEVVVVPFDEQDAEPESLTVYALAKTFYTANSNGPTGNVTAYYSKKADEEALLADSLDASWDDSHNELIVLEIALYLAVKDGRAEELGGLFGERDRELARYVAHLEHHLMNVRSRWGPAQKIVTPQTFSPSDLLIQPGKAA